MCIRDRCAAAGFLEDKALALFSCAVIIPAAAAAYFAFLMLFKSKLANAVPAAIMGER